VKELQDFLRENKMEFDVDPPREQVKAAKKKFVSISGECEGLIGLCLSDVFTASSFGVFS
jgi:hypothetical protein